MRFLRIGFYVIRQSAKNIARNLFMVFASIVVVFSVLLVVGVFIEAGTTLGTMIEQFSDRAEVQINFSYIMTEEESMKYFDVIKRDPRVKECIYISKQENLEKILDYFKDNKELFESYRESERLKFASIEVQLNSYEDGESFVAEVKNLEGIDSVKDIVGTVEKMELIRFWVNVGTITASLVMTALSLLLIFNTVKLTVLARRKEIMIMKYIGATDVYIATPFVIEGIATGLIGALLAYFALYGVYNAVINFLTGLVGEDIVFKSFGESGGGAILLSFLLFGAVSGFIASALAAKRYMKV
ncbi:MAG: permease-like cell division protein FtsX [Clostridia bacterium]|nr:permease-like cell division protein FtsX [Clostridia bacterium]